MFDNVFFVDIEAMNSDECSIDRINKKNWYQNFRHSPNEHATCSDSCTMVWLPLF